MLSLKRRVDELERANRNLQAREKRAKLTCKNLLQDLKDNHMLTAELEEKLKFYNDVPVEFLSRAHSEYSPQQRSFALTLHLYSPKAYDFLRRSIPLPSPRTLRRWLEKVDSSPGINTGMIDTLCEKRKDNPEAYTHCVFMLDAMAIRKQVVFDQHSQSMLGFVDIGTGEESEEEAKEALVFMAVGLKGGWKAPLAFYFTPTLSAETQTSLVRICLEKLAERGFVIHAVTMDGHASNQSMCTLLGASMNLDNLQPYFQVPLNPCRVWLIYDACHMIKLIRNSLEAYRMFVTDDGVVCWDYILQLHLLQQAIGLHFANKLSKKHVQFQQQKMKVSLAVQTISSSVAKALEFGSLLGLPQLAGSEATCKFLKANRLFWIFAEYHQYQGLDD